MKNEPRLKQTDGIFDLTPGPESALTWSIDLELPDTWSVGAIVGESGSGKTIIARELAKLLGTRLIECKDDKGNLKEPFDWDRGRAVCAHADLPIRDWTGLLSRVGFSSPPAWRRPYQVLSNGQQFRCNLARAIAEAGDTPVFFDEFASLVHDQVASIASAAAAKAVRSMKRRLVAVTWRQDILNPLEPDWVIFCGADQTVRLQLNQGDKAQGSPSLGYRWHRPPIALRIKRVDSSAWSVFKGHHYLSAGLNKAAKCFVGFIGNIPAVFTAVLSFPHPRVPCWREHRTVCLPDFQGVGVGNAMSEYVGSLFAATGKKYRSTTSHPAMINHRRRSPVWRMIREPSLGVSHSTAGDVHMAGTGATSRLTAGFEYCGPTRPEEAKRFGVIAA